MTSAASVAVVVASRDRSELLAGLVPALVDASRAGLEVVVVDSASRGPETRALAERSGLPVVRCDEPGVSRARNAGLRATTAPFVVFTDDDCRPHPGWHVPLVAAFDDPQVGFATGRVVPGAGPGRAMSPMLAAEPRTWSHGDDVASMGHGANMAIRRAAVEALGGFDELLGAGVTLAGSEDKDLFWRLLLAGWTGRFVPGSVVEHVAWRGQSESLRNAYRYGLGIGAMEVKTARVAGSRPVPTVGRAARSSARQAVRELRRGGRFATANLTLRAVGIVVGGLRAGRHPVAGGHFQPPSRRRR